MSAVKIKICGITNIEIAEFTAGLGVDYIGLVFYAPSKRNVNDLETVKDMVKRIKAYGSTPVAVFVDQDAATMQEICEITHINCIQLSGENARQQHHLLPTAMQRIWSIPVNESGKYDLIYSHLNPMRDFLMFEYKLSGTGTAFDHSKFNYVGDFNYFVAGGLNTSNVAQCIHLTHPFAVDASSGLENSDGTKDKQLIQQFIARVKHA